MMAYKYSPKRHRPIVYFAKIVNQGLIKIGTTRNLEQRLSGLRLTTESEVEFLGLIHGDYHMEHIMCEYFKPCAAEKQEWFTPCLELLEFIKSNTTKDCPPLLPPQPGEEIYSHKSVSWQNFRRGVGKRPQS